MPLKKSLANNTMAGQGRVPLKSAYSQRRMSHFEFFLLVTFMVTVLASFLALTLAIPAVILSMDPAQLGLQQELQAGLS